jgi:hypothetical protein
MCCWARTRRSDEHSDPRPIAKGMMRKTQSIHLSWHVNIGKEKMDRRGLSTEMLQSAFGVFGFKDGKSGVRQDVDGNLADQ